MDTEKLKFAKSYIYQLANGINPLNGEKVPDNDIINNLSISRCLFYVYDVLNNINNKKATKQKPFSLSEEQIHKYEIIDEDLAISSIVKKINELKTDDNIACLKVKDICDWLVSIELLTVVQSNNRTRKVPTELGKNMGIYTETRFGLYGNYEIVLYKKEAQEFIVDNFSSLLNFISKN
jgi:hypothetical protein